MIGNTLARRYARAVFDLGKKGGTAELEKIGAELNQLCAAVASSDQLRQVLNAPVFSAAEKRKLLNGLSASFGFGKTMNAFCGLLADKGRMGQLPAIAAIYNELLDAEKGIIRGELITAVELDNDKRKKVREQLEKQAGRPLDLSFDVNKDILGGVMLKVGDMVMDASLRAQLSILKDNIKRGEQGHAD